MRRRNGTDAAENPSGENFFKRTVSRYGVLKVWTGVVSMIPFALGRAWEVLTPVGNLLLRGDPLETIVANDGEGDR